MFVAAESLTIYAGERWDFVLNATNRVDNYWMKFRGLKDCGEKYNKAYSLAVLHYAGAAAILDYSANRTVVEYESTERHGMVGLSTSTCISRLQIESKSKSKSSSSSLLVRFEWRYVSREIFEYSFPIAVFTFLD